MRQMLTLIRRELLEHRSSWMVTSVFGALFVVAALFAMFGLVRIGGPHGAMTLSEIANEVDPAMLGPGLQVMLISIAVVLNLVMIFVVLFYFLDALYAERKDRSILFWKSLPVSDLKVVGSKYLTGVIAIPLLTVVVFLFTGILTTLIGSLGLAWAGAGLGDLLTLAPGALAKVTLLLIYTLAVQALWFAPFGGWLLLVSAFARRAVLGWAVLPPVLVVVAERTLLGSRHFLELLGFRMLGGFELAFSGERHAMLIEAEGAVISTFPTLGQIITPARLLAAPALWAGIAVGLLLLAGAVWLRRWRDDA
jgi:ABC-2 type transport system permease protein